MSIKPEISPVILAKLSITETLMVDGGDLILLTNKNNKNLLSLEVNLKESKELQS